MSLNEFWGYIEMGFQQMALLMELLQNGPNLVFTLLGFVLIAIWLFLQATFPKEKH